MSYTELESGYQDLRQSSQQATQAAAAAAAAASVTAAPGHQRPGFYLGHDGNGDTDLCESNDGMDSDCSTSSCSGKQVLVGICAMAKKTQSKPMKEILTRLQEFEFIKMVIFQEDVILKEAVENWPVCDCLVSFHSKGFPLEKAIQYAQLRSPFVLNNLHMQFDIQDRRRVYAILQKEGIEIPRYAVLDRDSPDPKQHELVESEDHVEVNGIIFNKPFVEKPVSAEDHNIYIYYPTSAGGGSQRLFRKIGSRSSVYSPESRVRKTGSFIYEDFMPTDGTDVKVYTVGPDYAHAEARKSPALDGKVERDSEGKEIRYPVILNHAEKLISRKVCMAFKQTVCGFDLLRANGKSYVCDVNGFSFVKNSNKYYDDCAKILGNMILRELTPTLHIPWSVPFQLDDPPIVPTTFGKMMELRCVVAVIRHGDRTPKQKMKVEVRHPKFFEIFEKYDGYKHGHVKLKRPKQLQEILDIARFLLAEIETKAANAEVEEKQSKLEQLKSVLEMYGHFSGINRKVQMKYQPKGRPRGSSSDDGNTVKHLDAPKEPSLVLILKWGGELTPAGRIQAEELGRIFRCMYPGGQGRQDYSGTQGLGLLRLHSTFRHDLKIYASDEGRVQMTAAAFAKGLLALEGELTPILVQMVKSANTNGLLDNDCDSSKYQNLAKNRLHDLMQNDRDFTPEDRQAINPGDSISINQALDFVKNPVECCNYVHNLIKELLAIISVKKDDPKTKDAILYHGETWDLMGRRWEKIEKDFSTKCKMFDISKIPDIYDCIKYDLQHNQHTLQYDQAEELYIYAKYLADIVIPQEYGLTIQEKLTIGQGICTPLLKKIKADLQRNIEESDSESVNRLNPHYSMGVASPERHVRTRLYFTSESHVHSLLTVLRYGSLLNVLTDEQWRRAMDYISMVSELNYMSQIVIMLYEDPTKDPTSEERFHVELHFSPGVNCCVQKNLPPGPGFRPHSRNDSGQLKSSCCDEGTTPRIEEENDDDNSKCSADIVSSPEEKSELDSFPQPDVRAKQIKSKPIPIGAHHTVSGHEAMDLAKRLSEQLAAQQQVKQIGSLEAPRPISPDGEPRSRSFEQRHPKNAKGNSSPTESYTNSFKEISNTRESIPTTYPIRVTDSLTFFKIDSSTNELPLSDIDFSHSPGTPDTPCKEYSGNKKQQKLLAMRRLESGEETELFVRKLRHLPQISPQATNERPLSCYYFGLHSGQCDHGACSHSKSLVDMNENNSSSTTNHHNHTELLQHSLKGFGVGFSIGASKICSFDDDFQLSSSAPGKLESCIFKFRVQDTQCSLLPRPVSPTNSPTASTLELCKNMDYTASLNRAASSANSKSSAKTMSTLSKKLTTGDRKLFSPLLPAQSAPVIAELVNPFKFPLHTNVFVNHFATIEETSGNIETQSISSRETPSVPHVKALHAEKIIPDVVVTDLTVAQLESYASSSIASLASSLTHSSISDTLASSTLSNDHKNNNQFNQKFTTNINPSSHVTHINEITTITTTTTTPINITVSTTTTATTTTDSNTGNVSGTSSVSSRRQRHSIAGQMSYMKMLGFGGFSKKMATSSSSLFSTAVISGSSSAPNLRDMIPCASSSSVLEGFGGVPPIRPLETLHNALSLKQLDNYLQKMTEAPLFKTPASSPPKNPSTPLPCPCPSVNSDFDDVATPTNQWCRCCPENKNSVGENSNTATKVCAKCGRSYAKEVVSENDAAADAADIPDALAADSTLTILRKSEELNTTPKLPQTVTATAGALEEFTWSKQTSIASSTEPSSPAISDSCSHDTHSEISISLASTEEGINIIPAAEELAKFFPQLDEDLNSVSIYAPMNTDTLNIDTLDVVFSLGCGTSGERSNCLTPVSVGMDISMVANKGSMTLSMDGLDDDDETTLSAATTPSLPADEYRLETCHCCPTHAEQAAAAEEALEVNEELMATVFTAATTGLSANYGDVATTSSAAAAADAFQQYTDAELSVPFQASKRCSVRKTSDAVSPRIQKQISLFEGEKDLLSISSSINLPTHGLQSLKQDARLRKFENLTQSTSNSNFPFESNMLKKSTLLQHSKIIDELELTKSCINLKSTASVGCASTSASATGSPQHSRLTMAMPMPSSTQSMMAAIGESVCDDGGDFVASVPPSPHPGAIIVKTKFIEPPRRITRSFHGKTQSMDSELLLHEFLSVPPTQPVMQQHSSSSGTSSSSTSPSARQNNLHLVGGGVVTATTALNENVVDVQK